MNHQFSDITARLSNDTSEVWSVHRRAQERLDAGEDVLMLSVGDPDLPTLPTTIYQAIDSLVNGRTHYPPPAGENGLRETIAEMEGRISNKPCSVDEVLIFPGATNAIFTVLSCLLNPGDEVVILEPMYVGYYGILDSVDANIVSVPLDSDNGFEMELDAVKAAISSKTRVVFLNTPGNPAGNMIEGSQLADLAAYCLERDIWVVSDEVYSMITYDRKHTSLRTAAESLDNVVVIDGLSKSHAMTGWRLGWTVAGKAISEHLLRFTTATIFSCSQFVQDAANHALQNDEAYMAEIRAEYVARRDYVCGRLSELPQLKFVKPNAGMFVMVDVSAIFDDGQQFAEDLLDKALVSVLPGGGFGESTRGFVRLSLAQATCTLEEAMDRLEEYLKT